VSSPPYLTVDEVIERYRGQVSEGTLRNWRALRVGPSFIKIAKVPLLSCRRARPLGPIEPRSMPADRERITPTRPVRLSQPYLSSFELERM
jgi:hypothetical protein